MMKINFSYCYKKSNFAVIISLVILLNSIALNQSNFGKSTTLHFNDKIINKNSKLCPSGDRLTLINGSNDFLKVDIDIYVMESINLTFYYTDLETNITISNLDNLTYSWQKYNDQGDVVEKSNGTLIVASDNSTILDLDTEFLSLGNYVILIYLNKVGYGRKIAIINMHILHCPTLINDVINLGMIYETIYEGDALNFTFSYKDYLTGINLTNLDEKSYLWEKLDHEGNVIDNGAGELILSTSNLYILDFDTQNQPSGNFILQVLLRKINYTQKTAIINLYINKRNFNYVLSNNFIKKGIEYRINVLKGHSVILLINLTDSTRSFIPLENASIILTIGGNDYEFKEIEDGIYKYEFFTDNINAFFEPIPLKGFITITKETFDPEVIEITFIVGMLEIFPDMPLFYFLNIVVPFFIIILGLFLYRHKLNHKRKD